jgi:hypothetical protein
MKPRKKAKPYGALKTQSAEHKLLVWFLQLSLVSLSRFVTSLTAPLGRVLTAQLFLGRSCGKLLTWLKGVVLHWVAWLFGPALPRNHWVQRWSRQYGVEVIRRCHVILGERARSAWRPRATLLWLQTQPRTCYDFVADSMHCSDASLQEGRWGKGPWTISLTQ